MTQGRRNKWLGCLLLLNLVALPAGLLPVLVLAFDGMPSMFSATVQVKNLAGEPRWVTPIGRVVDGGSRRIPLAWVAIDDSGRADHNAVWDAVEVQPGGSLTLRYDWDDVRLSEIVVWEAGGERRWIRIDSTTVNDAVGQNTAMTVDLNEASGGDDLTADLRAALESSAVPSRGRVWWVWFVWPWLTVLPVAWWWLRSGEVSRRFSTVDFDR